jgi:hypothetical protein
MPPDDGRGVSNLFKELNNPRLDIRYKASIEIRNIVSLAHRGKHTEAAPLLP